MPEDLSVGREVRGPAKSKPPPLLGKERIIPLRNSVLSKDLILGEGHLILGEGMCRRKDSKEGRPGEKQKA